MCKSTGISLWRTTHSHYVLTKSQLADARNKFTVNGTRSCNIKRNKNKNKNKNEKFILRWQTGTRDG